MSDYKMIEKLYEELTFYNLQLSDKSSLRFNSNEYLTKKELIENISKLKAKIEALKWKQRDEQIICLKSIINIYDKKHDK